VTNRVLSTPGRTFNHLAHCDSNDLALFVQQRGTARTRRNRTEGGV